MGKEEKSCLVVFNSEGIDVTLVGEWQRSDVDRAHVAIFKELPKHIVKRRDELKRKEKENE